MLRLNQGGAGGLLLRVAALVGPALLLYVAYRHAVGDTALWLGVGAAAEVAAIVAVFALNRGLPSLGLAVFATWPLAWIFVGLVTFLSFGQALRDDWVFALLHGILPLPLLAVVSGFVVRQSGALLIQQARHVAQQILSKTDWPADLQACKDLPIVQEFREAIRFDATAAIQLLENPKPQVRACALAAIDSRRFWRAGQVERVIALLHKETQPELQAAALRALIHTHEIRLLEAVAEKLKHSNPVVRNAAAAVLLRESSSKRRWGHVRTSVHNALSDATYRDDSSILPPGVRLNQDAIEDFLAWSEERGALGARASHTLAAHYAQMMLERPSDYALRLRQLALETTRSAELRVALTRLLWERGYADQPFMELLLEQVNPQPLRLLAADALLQTGPHMRSIACLREIGRQPNRELALATADVVQRRLGTDMGLAMGQPLPAVNSSRAVEVQRRLMTWSSKVDHSENALDTNFPAIIPRPSDE